MPADVASAKFGSSPRVRGTALMRPFSLSPLRFIPAGAGNGMSLIQKIPDLAVHPRGCGERILSVRRKWLKIGSSPRVRGTERFGCVPFGPHRFIPAGAGNGIYIPLSSQDLPVHPRGCGERSRMAMCSGLAAGSSPRVRGTDLHRHRIGGADRFIPAGAGNGPAVGMKNRSITVHPRGCGERVVLQMPAAAFRGSSPRVRGTGMSIPLRRLG